MNDIFKNLDDDNFDVDKFNEECKNREKESKEMFKAMRIETLEKVIPEMVQCRNKHFTRRLCITFVSIFVVMIIILRSTPIASESLPILLLLALFLSFILLVVSYLISSFTFLHSSYEAMIIEKMLTEYNLLTEHPDKRIDMLSEIDNLRRFL